MPDTAWKKIDSPVKNEAELVLELLLKLKIMVMLFSTGTVGTGG